MQGQPHASQMGTRGPRLHFCTVDVGDGDRPVLGQLLSSIPGLHPPDSSGTPSLVRTVINVPRHHQASPEGQNHPS